MVQNHLEYEATPSKKGLGCLGIVGNLGMVSYHLAAGTHKVKAPCRPASFQNLLDFREHFALALLAP